MAERRSFHIQQNLTPERLWTILGAASDGTMDTASLATECGLGVGVLEKVVLPFVRRLGFITPTALSLTKAGEEFYRFGGRSPTLLAEAVHHLLYTSHAFDESKRFSWAYARVVDALWTSAEQPLNITATSQLVGMVAQEAVQAFGIPMENIAFSTASMRGILNWLRALEPQVIASENRRITFKRRYFCDPRVFLWAVDFLYHVGGISHGIRLFLAPERAEQICRLCLLDLSGLENVLMMSKRRSDYDRGGIFDYGTEGGFGRWLLLTKTSPVPTSPS